MPARSGQGNRNGESRDRCGACEKIAGPVMTVGGGHALWRMAGMDGSERSRLGLKGREGGMSAGRRLAKRPGRRERRSRRSGHKPARWRSSRPARTGRYRPCRWPRAPHRSRRNDGRTAVPEDAKAKPALAPHPIHGCAINPNGSFCQDGVGGGAVAYAAMGCSRKAAGPRVKPGAMGLCLRKMIYYQ